jgi:hypothetical protein
MQIPHGAFVTRNDNVRANPQQRFFQAAPGREGAIHHPVDPEIQYFPGVIAWSKQADLSAGSVQFHRHARGGWEMTGRCQQNPRRFRG